VAVWSSLSKHADLGLLVVRVGIGGMFMGHGLPKLLGGPEQWSNIGKAMGNLGLDFAPAFWGFCAGLAEFGGGALLALGLWTRPACLALAFTMLVASLKHVLGGDGFTRSSHAIEAAILFLGLILIGPGRYSLDKR
jgi:putative oxidoreductase